MPPRSGEDEAAHLGVPAPRLMAEVDPGLEELASTLTTDMVA